MADSNKKNEYDIFIAQSIYPEAASIFTSQLKSLEEIKDDCYIVLDTNVLVAPYIIGKEDPGKDDLLEQCKITYKKLIDQKRLIIPGQVAREFTKIRIEKLAELHHQLSLKKQTQPIQRGKYPLLNSLPEYQEVERLQHEINHRIKVYQEAISKVLTHIQSWQLSDPVLLLYSQLFDEDVIYDPQFNEEETKKDLQRRQAHHIPPGYKDAGKEDSGIGDLLIWYTILELGKAQKKSIIFVSGDGKPDWFRQSENVALYLRYELVDEFRRQSGGQSFHVIKFAKFLKLYGASEKVVEEVRQEEKLLSNARASFTIAHELAHRGLQTTYAVLMWLRRMYRSSRIVEGWEGLDFIKIDMHGKQTGVIVKFCEFPIIGEEISNLYSALDTIFDGQKLNELLIFIVYSDSYLATSELVRLEKKLTPLPNGISIASTFVDDNNHLQIAGTIPKFIFAG